jgi:hypothetical protein
MLSLPRRIVAFNHTLSACNLGALIANPFTPSLFHVNQESRMLTLKYYKHITYKSSRPQHIYFSPQLDSLLFSKWEEDGSFAPVHSLLKVHRKIAHLVQHLVVPESDWGNMLRHKIIQDNNPRMRNNPPSYSSLLYFNHLQSITVPSHEVHDKWTTMHRDKPLWHSFPSLKLEEWNSRQQGDLCLRLVPYWRSKMHELHMRYGSWKKPELELARLAGW